MGLIETLAFEQGLEEEGVNYVVGVEWIRAFQTAGK